MAFEEGGKAVNAVVDALKSQPLTLALVLMNLALLGYLYYMTVAVGKERHTEMELLYDNRKLVTEALSSCIHINDLDKILGKRQ